MADVIDSRSKDSKELMMHFKQLVVRIRRKHRGKFLSPLTITLGDEFQGIVKTFEIAVDIIFSIEEELIKMGKDIKLRYIVEYGSIETNINSRVAYEMLGKGLTDAREHLNASKKDKEVRVVIFLKDDAYSKAMEKLFFVLTSIYDKWKLNDYYLIEAFLEFKSYLMVSKALSINRSQVWKRQKTLMIKEYFALKESIQYFIQK